MRDDTVQDPYHLGREDIEDPPRKFSAIFRRIGPGLILAGSVVGPGELVATPVLGAEIGYTLLWLILLSCIVKVAVQNELGRYTIATGETALEAFNRIPGPRFLVSWVVWLWLLLIILTMFSMGGMLGAMAEILNRLFPVMALSGWVWIVSCGTVVLVGLGRYGLVEKVSLVLTVLFSVLTVGAVALLFKSPQYFSWAGVVDGLSFRLPEEGFITAVAAPGARLDTSDGCRCSRDCLLDTGKCAVIRFIAWTYETGFSGESNGKLYRSCRPCSGAHSRKRRCGRMRSSKLEAIWIS